ncbi:MAG: M48 family metallopeptidase [Flavobacteriia bacterium]|nr:M48 family metallopeptidase [Flavobacteriia bacterium]
MTRARFLILLSVAFILSQCSSVPLTGRKQFNLLSDSEMHAMSFQQYNQVISESELSNNAAQTAMIERVGLRISTAVESYLKQEGMEDVIEGFEWEFKLIESDQLNAWCMPGGKVAFYTGILEVCQDDAGVAVVMGHEIAHAIARHGSERMSQGLATQFGGQALSVALANEPALTQQLALTAFGLGAQFGAMLPFSRLHETEADELGLYFMAMAGYDPEEAPKFWQRMSARGGAQPPEFLSTHPNHETRISDLNSWMPKAKEFYTPQNNNSQGRPKQL